jgi:nucleoredoxin
MGTLLELFGEKLQSKSGEVKTSEALTGKGGIALYFSAHWCPPCRSFTPKFAEMYSNALAEKGLEVVFVSSDKDEKAFNEYYSEQPWLSLPYSDRTRKEQLSKKFKVKGIPALIILDGEGKLITKDGREAVSEDPKGEKFPWIPKKVSDVLAAAKLVAPGGEIQSFTSLQGKATALYFSAHWCPPCRGFTPRLKEWYEADLKSKGLDIVFVSSDRDEASFKGYFAEQPWHALEFSDQEAKHDLSKALGVSGIPSLIILDKDGTIINKDGRSAVTEDPKGESFPWYPKPVQNLKSGPGNINEVPTVIAFCETSSTDTKTAVEVALGVLGKKYADEAKAKDLEDPDLSCMIVTEASGLGPRIRGMLGLPKLPPAPHEHPLELKEPSSSWGCDGCGCSGEGKQRFRCMNDCDFDFCECCNEKSKLSAPEQAPRLMLLDIPDEGAFYEGPEGEITEEAVAKFVADYQAKNLERKHLQG